MTSTTLPERREKKLLSPLQYSHSLPGESHLQVKLSKKEELKPKKEESLKADIASNYRGKDGALYTFEIFMRDKNNCRTKKDRPGKADPRAPIIYDSNGVANAIIPANHKLMLLATRIATHPRQFVKRGNYVLFKFFVDGEALSEVKQFFITNWR